MNSIIILGAGGHGKVVADTLVSLYKDLEVFFFDDKYIKNELYALNSYPVLGKINDAFNNDMLSDHLQAFVAIGNSKERLLLTNKLSSFGYKIPYIIHPSSYISPSASISKGALVLANTVIQASAKIGNSVIINNGSTVDHDCNLEDGVHVCPGVHIAGNVSIGKRSWVGIGSSIIQNISIGSDVTIGAGSVVINDIPSHQTAYGIPAKVKEDS